MSKLTIAILLLALATTGCGKESKGVSASLNPPIPPDVQRKANDEVKNLGDFTPYTAASAMVKDQFQGVEAVLSPGSIVSLTVNTVEKSDKACKGNVYSSSNVEFSSFVNSFVEVKNLGRAKCIAGTDCRYILLLIELTKTVSVGTVAIERYVQLKSGVMVVLEHNDSGKYLPMTATDQIAKKDQYLEAKSILDGGVNCQKALTTTATTPAATTPATPAKTPTTTTTTTTPALGSYSGISNNTFIH